MRKKAIIDINVWGKTWEKNKIIRRRYRSHIFFQEIWYIICELIWILYLPLKNCVMLYKLLDLLLVFFFPLALPKYNWQMKTLYWKCIIWWFDLCKHCKIITTVRPINTSITSHSNSILFCFVFLLVVRTLKVSSRRRFQIHTIPYYCSSAFVF